MTCAKCIKPDAPRVTLVDGQEVCTWCEEWRHECEARTILSMPTLRQRRAYLYGTPDHKGVVKRGIQQLRGEAAVKRLETTMMALWNAHRITAEKHE